LSMNIVLVEPEIPQNTGNIARTCAATGARLHLVGPLGFSIEDKYLKRAGLDYWDQVELTYHESLTDFLNTYPNGRLILASTKAQKSYHEITYSPDCFILFGKETKGLPEDLIRRYYDNAIRIPMLGGIRSLNLSNSVAIVLYEALRQLGFPGLVDQGFIPD
jgi:tRNA (cytidine/uridine-2'-O-)-methyltransferase